jgi:orotate phosphoribosyltransferase
MKDDGRWRRLLQILKEKSLKFGDFTLTSGMKSSHYIDGKMTTLDGEGAFLFADLTLDLLEKTPIDAVGGPTMGADPMVGALVARSHSRGRPLAGFIVRKEVKSHGTSKRIEGPFSEGLKVAVVEDVLTTGGSLLKAVDAVKEAGGEVLTVVALLDRLQGAEEALRKAGLSYIALFTVKDLGL